MTTKIFEFLSIKRNASRTIDVNEEQIGLIRTKFNQLSVGQDRDNELVKKECAKKLIEEFKLVDDDLCHECLNICMSSEVEDAAWDLKDLARQKLPDVKPNIEQILPTLITVSTPEPATYSPPPSFTTTTSQQQCTGPLKKIICIVHQKSAKPEVDEFLREFLFRQADQRTTPLTDPRIVHPICDNNVHPLNRGTILDLYTRQQMDDRGTVTSGESQTRFRLIESVSLTDEFDSWTFDHFHGLLDFWLAIDSKCEKSFPKEWKLDSNAEIDYIVLPQLPRGNDDESSKQSDRPSTKSLENFLRDICRIEQNGMFNVWFDALKKEENISTFAHLTNLNQKEWERIDKLPMNALKTIKFYIDQEKQMVEERKTKKTPQGQSTADNRSYSRAEIRANIHMIKLFFLRQLEAHEGIETMPRLEAFCVEEAFKEMRLEGFEDDGLFPDMQLFFQSLTVTENELVINKETLTDVEQKQLKEKADLGGAIRRLKIAYDQKSDQIKGVTSTIQNIKAERDRIDEEHEKQLQQTGLNDKQRADLEVKWSAHETELMKQQREKTLLRSQYEKELHIIETDRMTKENRVKTINKNFESNTTIINRRLVKPHRGFIMYGPPGTGKSVIMSKLAKKVGIAMVGPPLAAGELERPLVGQSEAIILDLCMRANRLPHLMCCVSIDEIDSLAPKRDEDSSEGKVAKISVLLSVIEGIKDVPNLMFFSATNRLHMMDEAFLRRMSGKFFVGRPSAAARVKILDEIPKVILDASIRVKLATATTNFSGAALKALNSAITVDYISKKRDNPGYQMKEDEALILADRTARQYQLYLGLDTLPRLLLYNLDDQRRMSNPQEGPVGFHLSKQYQFTGKILISLAEKCVRWEIIESDNTRRTLEDPLTKTEENLQQLLDRITSYGNDRNVQLLQLIDLNLLSSKGAYEEKKIFETLKERYDECMEYKRSMIIYDLDSLIGVNKSESQSSMGTSVSSSVVNQSIYIYVTSRFREAKIEVPRTDGKLSIERWAIAVVRDDFLLKKFTEDVGFMLTDDQITDNDIERERSKNLLLCVKCRDNFIETENKMGSCTYHDGFLYDNLSFDLKMYTPSVAIDILHKEEAIAFKDATKKDEIERGKSRFKYICCHGTFQAGGGTNGCKKGDHGREKDEDGWERNKIDARSYREVKEGIDKWEKDCFNDIGYNGKMLDLIKTRKTNTRN